jgi:hypothetical protein
MQVFPALSLKKPGKPRLSGPVTQTEAKIPPKAVIARRTGAVSAALRAPGFRPA